MYLIYRHLLNSAAGPFFFGLFAITFMLMIEILFKYVDLFVSKGVPFFMATKVLVLSLGHTFALSVPMAVLIAVLMSVGQLAADHEITAMKASGISLWAVLRPLLLGAAVIGVGLTAYNHFIFPESNHTLANLVYDISRQKPMLQVRPRQFTELTDKLTIYVAAKDDNTGRIEDVTIFERAKPSDLSPRMTTARWGVVQADHDSDSLLIELFDGEIHAIPDNQDPDKYQVTRFRQHNLQVENAERDFHDSKRKVRGDREMNLKDLWAAAEKERAKQDEIHQTIQGYTKDFLKWQWKLLTPDLRVEVLGRQSAPAKTEDRQEFLAAKFRTTRLKVERAVNQAKYQEKILESYKVRENKYMVEFHKKFAIPFACLVFALLGVPMAVTASRSGKGVSVSLAIIVYLFYYLFLVGGEKFADRGRLDPFLAMWSANILLTGLGIPVFLKTVRESSIFSFTWKPKRPPKTGDTLEKSS